MRKQLIINLISNLLSLGISTLISLWLVPFMINHLGADAYGYVPLTQQLINYLTVVTIALNSMIARFFTVAMERGDKDGAEKYFNTSLYSNIMISLLLMVPLVIGTVFLDRLIKIPPHLVFDVQLSFILFGLVFVISTISSTFSVATFYTNKLYLSSVSNAASTIVRAIAILLLFYVISPMIWQVGFSSLASMIVLFALSYWIFRKILPDIKVSFRQFDRKKFTDITFSGLWMSLNWSGAILFLYVDLLVANRVLGPRISGEYAAVLQWSNMLRVFCGSITGVFGPAIISLYAQHKIAEMVRYTNQSVKLTGLMIALPIGLICGLAGPLLSLWINPEFKKYEWLLFLTVIHLSINLAVQPMFIIQTAINKVKIPAIVTLVMGAANVLLAIILAGPAGMGVYGIALAGCILLTAKNIFFTPIYNAHITGEPIFAFCKSFFQPIAASTVIAAIGIALQHFFSINSLASLFVVLCVISLFYCAVVYFVFLTADERRYFHDMIAPALKYLRGTSE